MHSFSMRFPGGKLKAMTFSYDDGVSADYRLVELMRKYHIKGTFNINTVYYKNEASPDHHVTKDFLKELANDPQFEITCHGHSHPYYTLIPQSAAINDIITNRKNLEEITDTIVRGFAYPYGPYNDLSEEAIKASGIVYARPTQPTNAFKLPENWLRWHPTCHHKMSLNLYDEFEGLNYSAGDGSVMYVWGHSYEFDNDNNWNLIETLFERCHKNPDIWFATNMEIYNYVEDFKRLVFSADGSIVHNPTRTDLYANLDGFWKPDTGTAVTIPAGATVKLY